MNLQTGLFLALVLISVVSCSGPDSFQGTELDSPDVAPPFRLVNQFGDSVGLSDMAGKVVVLTFLYTNCPDICPLTTETLRRAHTILGNDSNQIEMVAISVDPQRDSVESAYQYSDERDMLNRWHYLVGNEEQLEPIWKSYWLDPIQETTNSADAPLNDEHGDGGIAPGTGAGGSALPRSAPDSYLVNHTAPVFLIDRRGYRRSLFSSLSLDPQPLVHDIRLLIE
ncbi:MAG: SCO family protein [Dehalococcoidia bacterium]|nr:SCO family protein [Dehalococcoidia bacterium]